jgi:uncharacterized delta-60 repeat protein
MQRTAYYPSILMLLIKHFALTVRSSCYPLVPVLFFLFSPSVYDLHAQCRGGFTQPGIDGSVNKTVELPDGKLLLVGSFGAPANRIVRLNADGTVDNTFSNPGLNLSAKDLRVLSDGKILIVGFFTAPRNYIARLDENGLLDTTFNANLPMVQNGSISALEILPDGKILIGGYLGNEIIARLNSDGTRDMSFAPNNALLVNPVYQSTCYGVIAQPSGKCVVYGFQLSHEGLVQLNADGSIDTTFRPSQASTYGSINSAALLPDGKILTAGSLSRMLADGTPDPSFSHVSFDKKISLVEIQPDGKYLVAGSFTTPTQYFATLNNDGSWDGITYGPEILPETYEDEPYFYDLMVLADGNYLLSGYFTNNTQIVCQLIPPGAPTALGAVTDFCSASIIFTPPANDGGSPITHYEYSTDDGSTWTTPVPEVTGSPLFIPQLTPGSTYKVRLRAVNAGGASDASDFLNLVMPALITTAAEISSGANDGVLCPGDTVTLTVGSSDNRRMMMRDGYDYLWSDGGADATITVNSYGTYTVTVTSGNGCTGTSVTTLSPSVLCKNWYKTYQRPIDGGISYGNALFVAVGYDGDYVNYIGTDTALIYTSPNGVDWTQQTADGGNLDKGFNNVTFDNGKFVAVGYGSLIQTSSDGITWTDHSFSSSKHLYNVGYGNGLWVAVGGSKNIVTSPDAETWTAVNLDIPNDDFFGYAYGNGLHVAVARNRTVVTSPDGINWTQTVTKSIGNGYLGISFADGIFVAVGYKGGIFTSPDGATWTQQVSGSADILYQVVHAGGAFVVVPPYASQGYLLSSSNGISWKKIATGQVPFSGIAYDNNGVYAALSDSAFFSTHARPGVPTALVATPGVRLGSIAFTPPVSDGDSPITNYEYSTDGGTSWYVPSPAVTTTPLNIPNVAPCSPYEVMLRAVNALGAGPASDTVHVTAWPGASEFSVAPLEPTISNITAGNTTATVDFTPPTFTGSTPITNYEYYTRIATSRTSLERLPQWTTLNPATTTSPLTITGLTNGTTYEVSIRAVNADGEGCPSNKVSATPMCANPTLSIQNSLSSCQATNGTANLTVTGGNAPYSYIWSNNATTEDLTGLSAGTYTVTVTESGGCSTSSSTVLGVTCKQISGKIRWRTNTDQGVGGVTVAWSGDATASATTLADGLFSFPASGSNFELTPSKTTGKTNGITALDVTRVSQHVGGTLPFTDPYDFIAADINKSNTLTTTDVTTLQNALLNNPIALNLFKNSWRFVPTGTMFSTPYGTGGFWNFAEKRAYMGLVTSEANQDFLGIKIGDLVSPNSNPATKPAPPIPVVFTVTDHDLSAGAMVDVPFRCEHFEDLMALQVCFWFNPEVLALDAVVPTANMPMQADNFGTWDLAEGRLRMVWAVANAETKVGSPEMFKLRFRVLQGGYALGDVLSISQKDMEASAWHADYRPERVELRFSPVTEAQQRGETSTEGAGFELYQNEPNPFTDKTTIAFQLPAAASATLTVYDESGRVVFTQKGDYTKGYNAMVLDRTLLKTSGLMYYTLETATASATRMMIQMK